MKKLIFMATTALSIISASPVLAKKSKGAESFEYNVDKFADLQILRYRVPGFEELTPKQIVHTTKSVVESIFFVIAFDAICSVIFTEMGW